MTEQGKKTLEETARATLDQLATLRTSIEEMAPRRPAQPSTNPDAPELIDVAVSMAKDYAELVGEFKRTAIECARATRRGPGKSRVALRLWMEVADQARECEALLHQRGFDV